MANTFFGFDSTIDDESKSLGGDVGDDCLGPDCVETEEDEYDALNDETFGGLGDSTALDNDWEQQHEQFAEIAESSRHSDHIENSISQLVLDDSISLSKEYTDWSYPSPGKNGDIFNSALLTSLQKTVSSRSFINPPPPRLQPPKPVPVKPQPPPPPVSVPKNICTVEELERGIRQQQQKPPVHILGAGDLGQLPGRFHQPPPRLPPGIRHPMGVPVHIPPGFAVPPPGYPRMPPPPPHHPGYPGMMYQGGGQPMQPQFPVAHPYNFSGPPRMQQMAPRVPPPPHHQHQLHQQMQQQQQQQQQAQQLQQSRRNNNRHESERDKDEYAGLMTNREKQWLLNIQQLQLNTGTPYFDDYYYTVFKERKVKNSNQMGDRYQRYNRHHHRGNSQDHRQENTLTPRVYTPLQFENSLGKLQCGSVTAPRKIIDTDVVTLEKEQEGVVPGRDTRRTRQLLLELEGMYGLLLRAEDLRNPVAVANTEKLRELKQKQRLRELEAAPTPEQKREVLELLQKESNPVPDNQPELINRIIGGLLLEDKFTSYMNIRKGKMLLLRVLPYLTTDSYNGSFLDLWIKVLLSLPSVGRRDSASDNILPRLHPYFKRFIQTCKMSDIIKVTTNLTEAVRLDLSRSATPLGHQARAPLFFAVTNKFGASALSTMLIRTEYLISSDNATPPETEDWSTFVSLWSEMLAGGRPAISPLELVPRQTYAKHTARLPGLSPEQRLALERVYVDS